MAPFSKIEMIYSVSTNVPKLLIRVDIVKDHTFPKLCGASVAGPSGLT